MSNQTNSGWFKAVSKLLVFVMILGIMSPIFSVPVLAEDLTNGSWTYTNNGTNDTATFGDIGFTYYSPTTGITVGNSGGKYYVKSINCNGKNSNGIVLTTGSYADFTAPYDGVLTVYVGKATGKTAYVSTSSSKIGQFEPCGAADVNEDGFEVIQGTAWATAKIDVEKDVTYYITVSGSKMVCYGAEFAPNTIVSGTITDNYNVGNYGLKLTNSETGKSYTAEINGNTYTATVKPGNYTIALTGENALSYAVTKETNKVTAAASTTGTPNQVTADITIGENSAAIVSGNLTGFADGYGISDLNLTFIPEDTATYENVQVEITDKSYKAMLITGVKYTLSMTGAFDYELSTTVEITPESSDAINKDINFTLVPTYDVSGKFLGLGETRGNYVELAEVAPTAIKFINVDDEYEYAGNTEAGKYTAKLRNGSYLAQITCEGYSTSTHVIVNGGTVSRDLLLKDISSRSVPFSETVEVGSDKTYKTVQAAVDAVAAMSRPNNERVTIKIDPGTYREQVVINIPNITLESNGGNRENTKLSWYYGIGYKYYSCVNNVYDPYADYDKFEKGNVVKHWGSCVIANAGATGLKFNNITLENSFNKYMTEEEVADGVEPNGLESINVARKMGTKVDSKAATERAAAFCNYADQVEFLSCSLIGSQDTLISNNRPYDSYYKNCYFEGMTDFICGNGDVIFDTCEFNFCGYSDKAYAAYLTAQQSQTNYEATDGYIFRNCIITKNSSRLFSASYLGRPWGDLAKMTFINTSLQDKDMILSEGWNNSLGKDPASEKIVINEYNTMYNGVALDLSGRVKGGLTSIDVDKYSVESVFIANGWTPEYYTANKTTAPEFATNPALTSNNDVNKPNPGETLTVGYTLGSDWAAGDASLISWYAVSEGYDSTSLTTILESATLLESTTAAHSIKYQIPMACAGKYIMAVVTPMASGSVAGEAKYAMLDQLPVSSTWVDPSNPGSIEPGSGINIYLAGDSTVKDYSAEGIYNGGKILTSGSWGEYLQKFFKSEYVTVNNYAQGGRSLRSFLNEGKLDTIISNIKEGDYLFIQFGHNDSSNGAAYYEDRFVPLYTPENPSESKSSGFPTIVPTESMLSATPSSLTNITAAQYYSWNCGATYKGYLQYYIDKALEKGAIPVIVTPVSRMYYTSSGTIKAHHDANMTDYAGTLEYLTENNAYVTACKELYEENKDKGVLFIDAFEMTKKLFEDAYQSCGSDTLGYAIMDTGEKTHSNKTGGVIQAGLIAQVLQDANISLSKYVVKPTSVYGEEVSGEYIFEINSAGKFTARDKSLVNQPYWQELGQSIFDSLDKVIDEPVENVVSLDFNLADTMKLYEDVDNAYNTYNENGEYTGVYTNSSSQEFDVTIYKDGIQYYNHDERYGTKALTNPTKPIFSFVADAKATYTITVTANTGSGTVNLYTDPECTNSVESGTVTNTEAGNIKYKKEDATPQTLYFAASEVSNLYVESVSISKVETSAVVKGNVSGIESDDSDVLITLTSASETGNVTAADYKDSGIELIVGETYEVTAKGTKGIYKGTSIAPTSSGTVNITLTRVKFEFPLKFVDNFDDYKFYLNEMNYGTTAITDPYSGITIYPNAIILTDSYKAYGAKTNSKDIISFTADKKGTYTISVDVSAANDADNFIIKLNGTETGDSVAAVANNPSVLTVEAEANDVIELYAPSATNIYYTGIAVDFVSSAKPVGTVYLVGDSTVCSFDDNYYYPRYGYGTQISNYLDSTCTVSNLAMSGRSSKSYLAESNYNTLCNTITEGDVLIIGFGHNDEKPEAGRYTNPNGDYTTAGSFAECLYTNYIKMAQDKGAEVILCTPVCRRSPDGALSDSNKHITSTTVVDGVTYEGGDYAAAIRKLGSDVSVPVVDLTSLTAQLYDSIGPSETLYMHSWSNKKETSVDNTHLNIYGAKKVAYILAKAVADNNVTALADHVVLGDEPTKENDLVSNPNFVEKPYSSNLPNSTLWQDYKNVFKGTVFGDVGGSSKITTTNFTLETDANDNMHIKAGAIGKVTSSSDGIAMYYYKVPVNSTFSLTATATVNTLNANSQAAFGLMARDDMYIDTNDSSITSDYVVAGTLGTGINCFYRKDGALNKGSSLSVETLAQNKSYELSIVSNSDGYACTFGNEKTQTGGYDFKLVTIDSDYVYVGMFVARGMDVTFSDIVLTVDGTEVLNTKTPVVYTATLDTVNLTGATATLSKKTEISASDSVTVTITPNSGYTFAEAPTVTVDGATAGNVVVQTDGSYKCNITSFTKNATVTVAGEAKATAPVTYTITVINDGNGTATASKTTVNANEEVTLTATPNNGYTFKEWVVTGEGASVADKSAATTTLTVGKADVTVKATFEKIKTPADNEKIKAFVERLYTNILGRAGDEEGIGTWVTALADGTLNGATVSYGFVNSDEFRNSGFTNEQKVEIFYATFLNRVADADGKKLWVDALNAGVDIEKIFEGFVMSTEFAGICDTYGISQGQMSDIAGMTDILNRYRNRNIFLASFIARCYEKALGRAADVPGVDVWCMQIIEGYMTPRNVAADGFFHSDEFIAKNTTNAQYVSILYQTFLGRELDEPGYELWVGLLDRNEWTRDQVLDGFADSDEFAVILASFGLN